MSKINGMVFAFISYVHLERLKIDKDKKMITHQHSHIKQIGSSIIFFLITLVLIISSIVGWYLYYTSENNLSQLNKDNTLLKQRYKKNSGELFSLQMKQQKLRNQRFELEEKVSQLEEKNHQRPHDNSRIKKQLTTCLNKEKKLTNKLQQAEVLMLNEDNPENNKASNNELLSTVRNSCKQIDLQEIQLRTLLKTIEDNLIENKNSEQQLTQQIGQLKSLLAKQTPPPKAIAQDNKSSQSALVEQQGMDQLQEKNQHLEEANHALAKKLEQQEKSLGESQMLVQELQKLKQQMSTLRDKHEKTNTELKKVQLFNQQKQQESLLSEASYKKDKQAFQKLSEKFAAEIKSEYFSLSYWDNNTISFSINNSIMFSSSSKSTSITPQGVELLKKIIPVLQQFADRKVEIIGHTDDIPIKNSKNKLIMSNWELSALRSGAIIRYLQHAGKVAPERLLLIGASKYQPMVNKISSKARAQNRRTEIKLLK